VFLDKDRTMDKVQKQIFVLMHHRHKLLDLVYFFLVQQEEFSPVLILEDVIEGTSTIPVG
jgi:hypothetical protein